MSKMSNAGSQSFGRLPIYWEKTLHPGLHPPVPSIFIYALKAAAAKSYTNSVLAPLLFWHAGWLCSHKPNKMIMEQSKFDYLQKHPLFARTSAGKLEALSALLKIKTCVRGDTYEYGEGSYHKICLLFRGKIKIATTDGYGNEAVKDILTAPDLFGDLSLEGMPAFYEYAVALTPGTLIGSFSVADFRKILEDHPLMALDYANMVNKKLQRLEDRHSDLIFRDARYRLMRFIKAWAMSDGNRIGDKIVLPNYLTHSDIAGVISTSRQSVNVLLNELREAGMLFYNRKRIELHDTGAWS